MNKRRGDAGDQDAVVPSEGNSVNGNGDVNDHGDFENLETCPDGDLTRSGRLKKQKYSVRQSTEELVEAKKKKDEHNVGKNLMCHGTEKSLSSKKRPALHWTLELETGESFDEDEDWVIVDRVDTKHEEGKKLKRKLSDEISLTLPDEFRRKIIDWCGGESNITLVIQKTLFQTDVNRNNNRISMPLNKMLTSDFLGDEERKRLEDQKSLEVWLNHKPTKIGVPLMQPPLIVSSLDFRQWDMPKNSGRKSTVYVLKNGWNQIVKQNELKEGDKVQIWASRKVSEDKLCMALYVVSRANS